MCEPNLIYIKNNPNLHIIFYVLISLCISDALTFWQWLLLHEQVLHSLK